MKRSGLMMVGVVLTALYAAAEPVPVTSLSLQGEIDGENIVFDLSMTVGRIEKGRTLPLVSGDVAYLEGAFPKHAKLVRRGNTYALDFKRRLRSGGPVSFRFASRAVKDGDWRKTTFSIPAAGIRKLSVLCDRDDLEIKFPGALNVQRDQREDGRTEVTAFLGIVDRFEVAWKPEVRKLDADLVVSCDANTIATASVGALRLDTVFSYRVIQGALTSLSFALPDVSIIQVNGEGIQDWRIDRTDPNRPRLLVQLNRPMESHYRLAVESEVVLPSFPTAFDLPVLSPENVLRTSGFLLVGTDSAIKLQVKKASGLTQVESSAFPVRALSDDAKTTRAKPRTSRYAYQYASTPYTLALSADDVVTSYSADHRLVLSLADDELVLDASIQLDVKDAPAREVQIVIDGDPNWTVTSVTGKAVSEADTDVRVENGQRVIVIPFKQGVLGATLLQVRLERSLKADSQGFEAPTIEVPEARSERGYLVVSAEKGFRLNSETVSGLREVHTASAPMRVPGAQQAYRFKDRGWRLAMRIQRTVSAVHSEVFHLVSLGEGVLYYSAAITYHVSGAPVQEFRVRVPTTIETVEFTGADIEGWTRQEDECVVRLQSRAMGDYTLLVTYDTQYDPYGADIVVGDIETVGSESEVGYIALASSASLKLAAQDRPAHMIAIDSEEIPSAYASPVADPIIEAYKYARNPHAVTISVEPYETEQLLGQIADYLELSTKVSRDGETLTTATYYVKNASRQYLVVRLPEQAGAELWSIKLIDEDGRKTDVLSQESPDGILIPVRRPRDPNTAIRLEVVYAQSHGELGFWRTGLGRFKLHAPVLAGTHATFVQWGIKMPERFAIARAGGNMIANDGLARSNLGGVLKKTWRLCRAFQDGWGGYTLVRALKGGATGGGTRTFTRTVSLADDTASRLSLIIVPFWMGPASSVRLMLLATVAGLLAIAIGVIVRRNRLMVTLGVTLLVYGVAQGAAGRSVLAVVLILAIAIAVLRFMIRGGFALTWRLASGGARVAWRGLCSIGRGIRALHHRRRTRRERAHLRKLELRMAAAGMSPTGVDEPPPIPPSGTDGSALPALLFVLALGSLLALGAVAGESPTSTPLEVPVLDLVEINIQGPSTDPDVEQTATVRLQLAFSVETAPAQFPVLPPTAALASMECSSDDVTILSTPDGYVLTVEDDGDYRVTLEAHIPVVEKQAGAWDLQLLVPQNMKNRVVLALPVQDIDVRIPEGVLVKTTEANGVTRTEAVLGPARTAHIQWLPRVRKVRLEEAVFFTEINTYAMLRSGVIDLTSLVQCQIAQGELKELKLHIPDGMSVTAVRCANLATWSFDPDSRGLEVLLERPVSGAFTMQVMTQVATDGLPYKTQLGVPRLEGASRQRGAFALAAPETVQVRLGESKGLNVINLEDFSPAALAAAGAGDACRLSTSSMRRAFRYHQADVATIEVEAEQVLPELRVVENGSLSVADERMVLATQLRLELARAGIFKVDLDVPFDFEVETLTGPDVSHWDESGAETADAGQTPAEPGTPAARRVVVYFKKRITGTTDINLVVARTEKGIESTIVVPRVRVLDAKKHTGRLTVSGERGVRMMVDRHTGVDIKKASEEGIQQAGVLVFDLLRPTWSIVLTTEVLAPLVKPDVLQWVDLTEGMLQYRAYVRYKIENAGIKSFRLVAPEPGTTLSVTGANIARVHRIDTEEGLWQVDLHGKVENQFAMTVSCQIPYDPSKQQVSVMPLRTVDAEDQRGYLVVTCGGRVQVRDQGDVAGLKVEDPRSIPASFGAGDLSNAILCYRTVRPDYVLELSVIRHSSAQVLPASIDRVRLTSVLSTSDRLLTRAALSMTVGDLRFLRVALPNPGDRLWTVLVNGKEVAVSRDEDLYCIPLEAQEGDSETSVELVYAGAASGGLLSRRQEYLAPSFDLPLNDVEWSFYALPGVRYYDFDGTMQHESAGAARYVWYDTSSYEQYNREQREESLKKAKVDLDVGNRLLQEGQQRRARRAFQQALNNSVGRADLNEDARVQLRNLTKQQFKIGLVNRRDAVRQSHNFTAQQPQGGFEGGDYTQEYAVQVEQRLTDKDNDALEVVATKMIEQQAAAAGVVTAIRVTMPAHGRQLRFTRALQRDPDGELSVSFKTSRGRILGALNALWPTLLLFAGLWFALPRRR